MDLVQGQADAIVEQISTAPTVTKQTVVLLTLPVGAAMLYPHNMLELAGRPEPAHLYYLYEGLDPVRLDRVADDAFELSTDAGWLTGALGALFRPASRPLRVEKVVQLEGMQVRIIAMGDHGRPTRIRVTFPKSLDDPSMRWLAWGVGAPDPVKLPAVGGSLSLPAPAF